MKNKKEADKEKVNEAKNAETEVSAKEAETAEAAEKTDAKDAEIAGLKDQMLRQLAEYDNFRKRTARERMETETDTISKTVAEFLPALDNLERALSHECNDENYKKGIVMIYEGFTETLSKLGVEAIGENGEDFNPMMHQAVQRISDSEFESGKICATFQKGYKIGEKVIRFAMVAVAE